MACVGVAQATAVGVEVIVEPDAKMVQSNPRGQTCPQTLKLMGPLSPEAKSIEQLLVDALHDLANASHPLPQVLGPTPLASVSFGRMDDGCSVTLLPAPVVLNPFETFVGYVWSRAD